MVLHHLLGGENAGSRVRRYERIRRRAARSRIRNFLPHWEAMEDRTLLATMLWTNAAGGDWDLASNWVNAANPSDQHVPTSSDNAQINIADITVTHASDASDSVNSVTVASGTTLSLSNGTLSIAAASTISGNLTMSGGTLSGSDTLTVTGVTAWTGGTMSGTGTTDAQGGLTLGGTVANTTYSEVLTGWTLNNYGTATLAGTYNDSGLYLGGGAVLDNEAGASFSIADNTPIWADGGSPGGGTVANQGTFAKTTGSGTSIISDNYDGGAVAFNQSGTGTVAAQSGTLALNGGGSITGTASGLSASAGATLAFGGGTFNIATTTVGGSGTVAVTGAAVAVDGGLTGATGTLAISSGTLTVNAASSVAALTMSSGTLNGTGALTVTGATTWTGGTMSGTGTTDAQGGLTLGGTVANTTYSEVLTGWTLNNYGTATLAGTYNDSGLYLGGGAVLDNEAGASFSIADNTPIWADGGSPGGGTVANQGTFAKTTGSGTSIISDNYDGGAVAFNQSGTGTVAAQSGTLALNGGGTFAGTVEATGGGSLTMASPATNLTSGTLTGATWIVVANSSMSLGANITTDAATIVLNGTGASFSSLSKLSKIAAGGSLQLLGGASLATTANLDNAGTVDLAPGTWNITGNYIQEATGALDVGVGGLAVGSQFGQLNVSGQAALNGALNISLLNGYSPPSGDSYRILTFGSRTGDFAVETGLYLGGGEGFSPTYDSSGLNLVAIPEGEEAGTTTTLASSLSPSTYGQAVTFTATVAPTLSTSLVPTGTVTFYDGSATLGTATLSGGTASFTTSILTTGSHSIIAQYGGDSNFSGSNSTPLAQTVNQDGSGTVVVSSLNPSIYGQSVTVTATVTAAAPGSGMPTGTVTFYDDSTSLGSMTLNNGTAILTTAALVAGSHAITASYGGDTNFTGSTSTAITQTVSQDGSATTLSTSSVNPSVYGQAVTFTATVAAAAPGSGTPTGTVTFYDGSTVLDTERLSGGSASLTTSALAVGSSSITASYGGDANFTTSSSTPLTQTVNQDGSATVVTGVPYPSVIGQAVTFTATVTAAAPGSGTPTGTVTFYDGSTALDTATLSGGSVAFATSALALGSHPITVVYGGDTNFTGSTSPTFTEVVEVVNEYASTTAVSSSVEPSVYGQSVTFTATVSATAPGEGTPTGNVTFYDGSTALDTETLSGGSATFSMSSLAVGTHSITAIYGGDANFNSSTSTVISQIVSQDGSTTVVSSSANPAVVGQSVTFTATVSAAAPGSGTPTGTVIFYDGSTALDTETLSGGTASFTTSALALGDHAISVGYGGGANFSASTSTVITQTVNPSPSATLSGEVYNDLNDDGTLQAGDPGLSGWTVQLLDSLNTVVATTTTDSSGDYSFTGVISGSYTVAPVAPTGYVPTGPTSGTLAVTATAGQTITNLNFGEFQTVTLSGEVFDDVSDSGSFNTNDPGLSGWTVDLSNASNHVIGTATTDTNGDYSFSGLGPIPFVFAQPASL